MPHIQAISVCVNYADLLAVTGRANAQFFGRWVIVTEATDASTQAVCRQLGLECVCTERLAQERARRGAPFAKGAAINDGLAALRESGWWLHIDADILLPPEFATLSREEQLDQQTMYGLRTYVCASRNALRFLDRRRLIEGRRPIYDDVPCAGYFQLFHSESQGFGDAARRYPECSRTAELDDVVFRNYWTGRRALLNPEGDAVGLHLGTPGVNWSGRKTAPF